MGWTYAFLNMCKLESFHESHTSGILPDKISTLQLPRMWEVNERLCTKEVGVDLELCVHAHRHDVDPIIEASCSNNYFLDIISFGIGELILCNRGSDHMFFLDPISRTSWSTCLLQSNTPVQPLLWSIVEYYPLVSRDIMELRNFLWVLHQVLQSHWFQFFHGLRVIKTLKDTDNWIESTLRFNNS